MSDIIRTKTPPIGLFQFAADTYTQPFWDAAREHKLKMPSCSACGFRRFPPTPFCPECHSQDLTWTELSGEAIIYSYTIVERAVLPGMAEFIPYMPIVVDFPDFPGVRLVSSLVDAPLDAVHVGSKVRVRWDDLPDGVTLPRFVLADD